jgi:hypothetical protein
MKSVWKWDYVLRFQDIRVQSRIPVQKSGLGEAGSASFAWTKYFEATNKDERR